MAVLLPVALGLVAALFFVIVSAEVFYLFYWRKRPLACPRLNNVTVAPVNEGGEQQAKDQTAVVIDVTCAEYQIGALQQDLVEKLFPSLSSNGASHEEAAHPTMVGPPRMLFTIREETREELEGLEGVGMEGGKMGGPRSRRSSSRSKSMGDIPLSPPPGAVSSPPAGTPFITPLSSPEGWLFSSPGSPLVTLSSSQPLKASCRIMCELPSPPPRAPPSPTRPTFSFLASRNVPLSFARPKPESPPASLAPVRMPLFQHLANSSPVHKQAECCVGKAPCPLRTFERSYFDEDDDSSSASLSSPSPDRSPNFFSTPMASFEPESGPNRAGIMGSPSPEGSFFSRRRSVLSPNSPGDAGESPYASPLLVIPPLEGRDRESGGDELEASDSPEGATVSIVLPTRIPFHVERTTEEFSRPWAVSGEVT